MRIMGLDPGTSVTGYGLVSQEGQRLTVLDYGVIRTSTSQTPEGRLAHIHEEVYARVRDGDVDAVAVEKLFFNKNVQSAMSVGQARGVIMLAAAQHGLRVKEYTPSQIKMAVTGYGKAPKKQVQAMVQAVLGMKEEPAPDDAADALAVAICCLRHWDWERKVEAGQ